jgi:hypothetical protein
MPPPFVMATVVVVSSIPDFCYHQSQFMRDQYIKHPELLEYTVRTVLGRAVTARWSRADIVGQFYQAMQPPPSRPRPVVGAAAATAAGTTAATTRRSISEEESNSGKLRLEENGSASHNSSSVADSDDADNDSLRPVAASPPPTTTSPARKQQKSEEEETTRTPTTATPKQPPPQVETPITSPFTYQNTNATGAASHQRSGGNSSSQNKKRDKLGRIKRPQGRAPKGKRWDDVNGRWIGDGDDVGDDPAVTKVPAQMRSIALSKDWKQVPVTANTGAVATAATSKKTKTAPAAKAKSLPVEEPTKLPAVGKEDTRKKLSSLLLLKNEELLLKNKDAMGPYKQPPGRPPRDAVWDRTVGQWRMTVQP